MALRWATFTNCCGDELQQKGAERPTATKAARATAEYGYVVCQQEGLENFFF